MARKAAVEERLALTRERIVAAASDLIERDGIGAFTMRSLGRELACRPWPSTATSIPGMPFSWPCFGG